MKIQMGVLEAFDHMVKNWKGRIPKDLHEASSARSGRRAYPLAERRAKTMLTKYGRGKYEMSDVVTFDDQITYL
jgi:hypothetical protein